MPYSEAQKRATRKYRDKAYDRFEITVPKGQRAIYKAQAAAHGLSLNAYIISLLDADAACPPDNGEAAKTIPIDDTEI